MTASVWSPSGVTRVLSNLNRVSQLWTAGVGATSFGPLNTAYTYGAQNLEVYKNGAKIPPSQVTEAGDGESFAIAACAGGEIIEAVVFPGTSNVFTALANSAQANALIAQAAATAAAASAASAAQFTGAAIGGDLNFLSPGQRIKGDLSNATVANRLMFQTSTVNESSIMGVVPNGTGTTSGLTLFNNTDPTNSSYASLGATATEIGFRSNALGAGTYLPMVFYTGSLERLRINTDGTKYFKAANTDYTTTPSPGPYGLYIQEDTVGVVHIDAYSSGGYTQLSFGTNSGGGAIREALRIKADGATLVKATESSMQLGVLGTTKGVRVRTDANAGWVEGVDNTGITSPQGLALNGLFTSLYANSAETLKVVNNNTTHVNPAGGLGYGIGAGGTVTQPASKSTPVTLNKPCGVITMCGVNDAGGRLAAGASVTFTLYNAIIQANDTVTVNTRSGTYSTAGTYDVKAEAINTGQCLITVKNLSAGTLAEALGIEFHVHKGAIS